MRFLVNDLSQVRITNVEERKRCREKKGGVPVNSNPAHESVRSVVNSGLTVGTPIDANDGHYYQQIMEKLEENEGGQHGISGPE